MAEEVEKERLFGLTVGTAAGIAAVVFAWQGVPRASAVLAGLGAFLLLSGVLWPRRLRTLERVWRGAGEALGWFNGRLVLALAFLLVVAPVGLVLRLLGRDLLGRRPNPERASYLESRRAREFPPSSFERGF
jgi:hypothetical protein